MNRELNSKKVIEKAEKVVQVCSGDACTICVKECLMLNEYMKSPKVYFSDLINKQSVDPKVPFSCTKCGYCEKVCPENIVLHDVFQTMRQALQEETKSKPVLNSHYNVYLHQKLSQTKFVKGSKKGKYSRAFMPGCSLAAYSPLLVEKTYDYLKAIDPNIGSITSCCSKPLKDLGHQKSYNNQTSKFNDEISLKGIKEIIVGCQNCYETLKKEYPELSIKTIWHIMDVEGLPEISNTKKILSNQYVIHDPCPAEKSPEIKNIVRRIIQKLGCQIKNSNEESIARCCGLGAMVAVSNIQLSKKITDKRIKNLDGEKIINYCAACTEAMGQGDKESYHLLELIFNDPIREKSNTIKKWMNRYETRKRIT